jgi:transcriptional regulator with XRE-family HTH domain
VPLVRELDPSAGPLQFFGSELRRARSRAGLSQDQLGHRLGYSGAQVGKVETGERAPSPEFARGCDQAFPESDGLFARLYELAQRWDAGYPPWFAEWIDSERRATSLRSWEPLIMPGLLQTAEYARAILAADPETAEDQLDELVAARLERQASSIDQSHPLCGPFWTRPCCTGLSERARSCTTNYYTWPIPPATATSRFRSCLQR